MFKKLIASVIATCCVVSYAQAASLEQDDKQGVQNYLSLELPETTRILPEDRNEIISPVFLAAADNQSSAKMSMVEENAAANEYEDRLFTANTVHKWLGIGSVVAALVTAVSPKEEDGTHENAAKASAAMALGAVATGLVYHIEDVSMDGGFKDPDNLHALWAGLGAVGIAMAASTGPDSPHATYGSLGAIGMIIGVKYTW